jgi:hypothetical protein
MADRTNLDITVRLFAFSESPFVTDGADFCEMELNPVLKGCNVTGKWKSSGSLE